jgi:hypothetical protein
MIGRGKKVSVCSHTDISKLPSLFFSRRCDESIGVKQKSNYSLTVMGEEKMMLFFFQTLITEYRIISNDAL